MILSDVKNREEMRKGRIVVRPYRPECLGTNSYDVHLGPYLAVYTSGALDARVANSVEEFRIPRRGTSSSPVSCTSASLEEYTETHGFVPFLEGKSSVGRLGIDIHSTAGKGDEGFCNYWTLEMSVKLPSGLRRYAGRAADLFRDLGTRGAQLRGEEEREVTGPCPRTRPRPGCT